MEFGKVVRQIKDFNYFWSSRLKRRRAIQLILSSNASISDGVDVISICEIGSLRIWKYTVNTERRIQVLEQPCRPHLLH